MKKLILIFALAAFTLNASAILGLQFGVKAGFNSSHFTTGNYDVSSLTLTNMKEDAKSGYALGLYARIPLGGRLRLQPELYYNSKNGTSDATMNNVIEPSKVEIKSWDIPILLNLKLIDLKVIEVYALGGPVLSFLSNPVNTNGDFEEKFKSAAWNLQAGLGAQVWKISVDTRYEWGLSNLSNGVSGIPGLTRKSNSFQINVSYQIF